MISVVFTPYGKSTPQTFVRFAVGPWLEPVRAPPVTKLGNGVDPVPDTAEMVIDPGALVIVTFGPAVRVANAGAFPDEPIKICPFVGAAVEATLLAFDKYAKP